MHSVMRKIKFLSFFHILVDNNYYFIIWIILVCVIIVIFSMHSVMRSDKLSVL